MRKLTLACSLALLALVSTGCEKLKARDHLNKGVQAFKSSKFNTAVDHFRQAVELDPDFPSARLYLATAYMSQYIPGAESEENQRNAKAAEQEFLKVLEKDPNHTLAIESRASLHYNSASGNQPMEQKVKKLNEADKWYAMLAEKDPNNKVSYYSRGVTTFLKFYPAVQGARAQLGMKPDDPGPLKDPKLREELRAKWSEPVNQGIKHLEKALEIDKEYDDAMAYINLLIRWRADMVDTPDQWKKEVDIADNWVQRTMDTKKVKAERAANKGNAAE
ncbi:MAG TPA: tetratricopeptide repeat protein [Bryobacteraceae bacterium]|nr:tetratricopeptide repeat protein [Bryobacteraceae bacterium]